MTKSEILFQLFAIATMGSVDGLDDETAAAVAKEVDRFRRGVDTKTNSTDLEALLNAVASAVGNVEAAGRVALREALDRLTKTEALPEFDFVAEFTKDVCLAWLKEREVTIAKRASVATINEAIATDKLTSFDDEPVQEANAKAAAEVQAAKRAEATRAAVVEGDDAAKRARPSRSRLTISEDVDVVLHARGKTFDGVLHPDGKVTMADTFEGATRSIGDDLRSFKSPSAAMFEVTRSVFGKGTNTAWASFVFKDDEGKERPIDALRPEPKGFEARKGGSSRRRSSGGAAASAGRSVEALKARVARYERQLTKAKSDLEAAEAKLAEAASADGGEGSAEAPASLPDKAPADTTTAEVEGWLEARTEELKAMKKKELLRLAKELDVAGRTKLATGDLIGAILTAEAAAKAAA